IQIAVPRWGRPDRPGLIGELYVKRVPVGLGIDRGARDPEPACGADHPAGDFPTIGDQDLDEHVKPAYWVTLCTRLSEARSPDKCARVTERTWLDEGLWAKGVAGNRSSRLH